MKKWKGSYTVEASLIVPLLLGVFAYAMKTGIAMYEEVQKQEVSSEELCEVKEFYRYQVMGEILDDES